MDELGPSADPELPGDQWEQVKELVFEFESQTGRDLQSWLDERNPPPEIRREVERLLRSASTCGNFLEKPAPQQFFGLSRELPERIGRYRIVEELGAGGMG